ncbi:MAG: peptidoglycan DD-metalloendopeptidase family protein [Chitinophagaceae bacterium]|nr:peptidoglycan DD-metalloendopeptidase family protein [Chitinophagaceae bacterium]
MPASLIENLLQFQPYFHSVVPYEPAADKLLPLDFTAANKELTIDVLEDIHRFSFYINKKLAEADARYGVGGYAEHRTVYQVSSVFDGKNPGEEPRRFHLGVDIWGPAGTPVMAPLEGTVHSFAFNDRYGDYGATIILSHTLQHLTFFTLYGHLSKSSIEHISEGDLITAGHTFASFGMPEENGHWPPHLHFQVIADIEGWSGDYPGVCRFSKKEKYMANCPDPNLILQYDCLG